MKTKLLFLLTFLPLLSLAQAPTDTVYIPDPNFKYRLINWVNADTNNDGEIEYSEAAAVTELDLLYGQLGNANATPNNDDGPIEDLTGIEAFVNLERLTLTNNALDSLDLSSNLLIEELYVGYNQLVYLNLGNNTHITDLICNNNNLTDLDLSQNINLQEIYLKQNNIDSLNLSNNLEINYLICRNNELIYLNLKGINGDSSIVNTEQNPNLTCIFVDDKISAENNSSWHKDATAHYVETEAECETLGVKQYKPLDFSIYPNPVRNTLHFSSTRNICQLILFNLQGEKLNTIENSKNTTINFSSYPSGIYFLKISSDQQSITRKIIKL